MLSVHDLVVDIEGSHVLRSVSFEVKERELVCLVGRNGAGKTTALRSIMGFRKVVSGSILFQNRSLVGLRPFQIARMGIGFAPEESEVFGELTVAENIAMPTWTPGNERTAAERINEAYNVFQNLRRYMDRSGQALSGGERKMLSIARALALGPKLLLLDEPTEGLSPVVIPSIIDGLSNIRSFGHAVFIAESNIHHVPDFADRLYVIERGEIIYAGRPQDALRNPAVGRIIEGVSISQMS